MNLYQLPEFKPPQLKIPKIKPQKLLKNRVFWLIVLIILLSSLFGFLVGVFSGAYFYEDIRKDLKKLNIEIPAPPKVIEKEKIIEKEYSPQTSQEEAIIKAVKEVSPAVVSIIITKDLPIVEEYFEDPFKEFEEFFGPSPFEFKVPRYRQKGTQKKEVGGGTGFIISSDGMILTNKHVVLDEKADYTVFTNDGRKFSAKVLARDPIQDLAILKVEQEKIVDKDGKLKLKPFSVVKLGNSDKLQIGQTVIAIGNALGEFRNTVSVGVISGLGRRITASGGGFVETLEDVIQTDAAINKGNSGGPLLNLAGQVIGINTAMALEAQSIGFAIPVNKAKKDIEQIQKLGKIVYPFLGVHYILINEKVKEENDLPVDYGAWIVPKNKGESGIVAGSAAEKAGLKEEDIILEFNGEKITPENSLAKIIVKYSPGDKVVLKILREKKEKTLTAILGERSE